MILENADGLAQGTKKTGFVRHVWIWEFGADTLEDDDSKVASVQISPHIVNPVFDESEIIGPRNEKPNCSSVSLIYL